MAIAVNYIESIRWGKAPPTPADREADADAVIKKLEMKWPASAT